LAAQYLIDHNMNFINNLETKKNELKNKLINEIINEQKRLNEINNKMKYNINNLSGIVYLLKNQIEKDIYKQKEELSIIKNKITSKSDGIHIFKDSIELLNPTEINIGDTLYLQWNDKRFKISINN
jgi:hypothetical protein